MMSPIAQAPVAPVSDEIGVRSRETHGGCKRQSTPNGLNTRSNPGAARRSLEAIGILPDFGGKAIQTSAKPSQLPKPAHAPSSNDFCIVGELMFVAGLSSEPDRTPTRHGLHQTSFRVEYVTYDNAVARRPRKTSTPFWTKSRILDFGPHQSIFERRLCRHSSYPHLPAPELNIFAGGSVSRDLKRRNLLEQISSLNRASPGFQCWTSASQKRHLYSETVNGTRMMTGCTPISGLLLSKRWPLQNAASARFLSPRPAKV